MQEKNEFRESTAINDGATALTIISWIFGLLFLFMGFVNTFWGGDTAFGIFIMLLSLIYFLPVNAIFQKITGFAIPKFWILKILLGLFIVWAAMGVGELPDKVELMVNSF